MRKIALILTLALFLIGCASPVEHRCYTTQGHYYTDGIVITADGNEWLFSTDTISGKPSYDGQAVIVCFDDNGTPENIYDDIIISLVWDKIISIYDQFVNAL